MYSKSMLSALCLMTFFSMIMIMVSLSNFAQAGDTAGAADSKAALEVEKHNIFKPENCARKAKIPDLLTLHYKGSLASTGDEFDSSYQHSSPFTFQLGIGQVIKGWDQGLMGVCVGEKIKLVVPPELGYGKSSLDKIPANSTLIFEVEILKIEDGPNPVNVFKEIDLDNDARLSRKEVSDFLKKQLNVAQPSEEAPADHSSILEEVFAHEDKDQDGFITRDEFSGPKHDHDEL